MRKNMLNKVMLMGRLTANPELRMTTSNIAVATFTLAVSRNYGKGEDRQTDFINCVAWRQQAEFINRYFNKGDLVALEGALQTRKYEDKQGAKRTATEVIVEHTYFTDGVKKSNHDVERNDVPLPKKEDTLPPENDDFMEITGEDDLPF